MNDYKYKIGVSGAEITDHCHKDAAKKAREIGKQIVLHNGVVITGACLGIPHESIIGAKQVNGLTIGVSPAISEKEHIKDYNFPTEYYDLIFYTGYGFSARDVWLMRMSDAVIFICGRIGTLNEFTICFEDDRLMGVLEGTGGTADEIKKIIKFTNKGPGRIIYEKDPKKLVEKICKEIDKEKGRNNS
ncbi:MAG: hypothetical protein ISS87_01880 [Candidatus Pacebacteria bacterium]|nr:hypothetical protein [Candidatus Paceibacterota bacterium]